MTTFFIDAAGALTNARRTAVGGLLVDSTLAKVGVMEYLGSGSKPIVRRYNPPQTLEAAMDGIATAPVTMGHPKRFVDVENYGDLAKGHVVGQPEFRDGHIHATLAINDATLIAAIESGKMREVSMGYSAVHDTTPGVTEDGQVYDESRVAIHWNHVAVVPAGRAGRSVRLMLDSEEIPELEMTIKINGSEVAMDEAQAAFDAYDASNLAQIATLTAERDALVAQRDAATAELAATVEQLAAARSQDALDALVAAELERRAAAAAQAEKRARVAKAYPSISLDCRSEAFIDGLAAALETQPAVSAADPEGLAAVVAPKPAVVADAAPKKKKPLSADEEYKLRRAEERARSHDPKYVRPDVA